MLIYEIEPEKKAKSLDPVGHSDKQKYGQWQWPTNNMRSLALWNWTSTQSMMLIY